LSNTDWLLTFLVSLVAGYIAMHIPLLKFKSKSKMNINEEPHKLYGEIKESDSEYEKELIREQNRKARDEKVKYFISYTAYFMIIGASLYYPLFFHDFGENIDFNKTKFSIDFILQKEDFFIASIIYASILYIPILYISNQIVYLYCWIQRNYHSFSNQQILGIRATITFFLAVLLAATIYSLLNINKEWWDAVKFTFTILLLPLFFALRK
jgi:hypothetical protein